MNKVRTASGTVNFLREPCSHEPDVNTNETVINFLGDWAPMSGRSRQIWKPSVDYLPPQLSQYFLTSQLNIANLETKLSLHSSLPRSKHNRFKAPPTSLNFLKDNNISVVGLANNHTMDFGVSGLLETKQHLKSYSISSIGAGICLEDIYRPYLFEDSNLKLAIINVADGQVGSERLNSGIGVADFNSFRTIDLIRQSKSQNYFTVVFVHAGVEFLPYPAPFIQEQYRSYVEQGADLVIGHHPHVIQGMELFRDKPIFFSIGHFDLFRPSGRQQENIGLLLSLRFNEFQLTQIDAIPFQISYTKIKFLNEAEFVDLHNFFNEISEGLYKKDFLDRFWRIYAHSRAPIIGIRKGLKTFQSNPDKSIKYFRTILSSWNSFFLFTHCNQRKCQRDPEIDNILNLYRSKRALKLSERAFLEGAHLISTLRIFLTQRLKRIRRSFISDC